MFSILLFKTSLFFTSSIVNVGRRLPFDFIICPFIYLVQYMGMCLANTLPMHLHLTSVFSRRGRLSCLRPRYFSHHPASIVGRQTFLFHYWFLPLEFLLILHPVVGMVFSPTSLFTPISQS